MMTPVRVLIESRGRLSQSGNDGICSRANAGGFGGVAGDRTYCRSCSTVWASRGLACDVSG